MGWRWRYFLTDPFLWRRNRSGFHGLLWTYAPHAGKRSDRSHRGWNERMSRSRGAGANHFVPLLMIGTIASQAVSRALCHTNFYSEIIERDGIELERHMPPRSLASLQSRPISTLANFSPIFANSTDRDELQRLCAEYPYQQFPLVIDGQLVGLIDRNKILNNQSSKIEADPAQAIAAHSTISEAVATMVENSISLLVVLSAAENTPIGIVTLHDVLRLQNQLCDAAL